MRTVFAVALCLVVGACAKAGPDAVGTWDMVSIGGNPLPYGGMAEHWAEVKESGVVNLHLIMEGESEPQVVEAEYSLGEETDGCVAYSSNDYQSGEPLVGSVCGDVLTLETVDGTSIVYHRRK